MKLLVALALAGTVLAAPPQNYIGTNAPVWAGVCPSGQVATRSADSQLVTCSTTPTPIALYPTLSGNLGPVPAGVRQTGSVAPGLYVGNVSIPAGSSAVIDVIVSSEISLAADLWAQLLQSQYGPGYYNNSFVGSTTGMCVVDGLTPAATLARQATLFTQGNCLGGTPSTVSGVTVAAPLAVQSTPASSANCTTTGTYSYFWCNLAVNNTEYVGLTPTTNVAYGGSDTILWQQCSGTPACLGAVAGWQNFPWRGLYPVPLNGSGTTIGPLPSTAAINVSCAASYAGSTSTVILNVANVFVTNGTENTTNPVTIQNVALALQVTCSYPQIQLCCATACCLGVCQQLLAEGVIGLTETCIESCGVPAACNTSGTNGSATIVTTRAAVNCGTVLVVGGVTTCIQGTVTNTTAVSYGLGPCGGYCDAASPASPRCPVPTATQVWTSQCYCRVCAPVTAVVIARESAERQAIAPAVQNVLEVFGCTTLVCCNQAFQQAACRGFRLTSCFCNVAGVLTPVTCPSCSGSKKGLLGLLGLLGLIPLLLLLSLSCLCLLLLCRRKRTDAPVAFATFDAAQPCIGPVVGHTHLEPGFMGHTHVVDPCAAGFGTGFAPAGVLP